MQLRTIGDSINRVMVPEDLLRQEVREALTHFVLVFFGGVHALQRFLWHNHWM
uniref:Uncharacterized protein n=1 Tax=Suricata suricatta TaxID=37032 RepID=A0A673T5A8_SURSU